MPSIFDKAMHGMQIALANEGILHHVNLCHNYMDDFLLVGKSKESIQKAFEILMKTFSEIGWKINEIKTRGPTQIIEFLGFITNTRTMTVSISTAKVSKATDLINISSKNTTATRLRQLHYNRNVYAATCGRLQNWMGCLGSPRRRHTNNQTRLIGPADDTLVWDSVVDSLPSSRGR